MKRRVGGLLSAAALAGSVLLTGAGGLALPTTHATSDAPGSLTCTNVANRRWLGADNAPTGGVVESAATFSPADMTLCNPGLQGVSGVSEWVGLADDSGPDNIVQIGYFLDPNSNGIWLGYAYGHDCGGTLVPIWQSLGIRADINLHALAVQAVAGIGYRLYYGSQLEKTIPFQCWSDYQALIAGEAIDEGDAMPYSTTTGDYYSVRLGTNIPASNCYYDHNDRSKDYCTYHSSTSFSMGTLS